MYLCNVLMVLTLQLNMISLIKLAVCSTGSWQLQIESESKFLVKQCSDRQVQLSVSVSLDGNIQALTRVTDGV